MPLPAGIICKTRVKNDGGKYTNCFSGNNQGEKKSDNKKNISKSKTMPKKAGRPLTVGKPPEERKFGHKPASELDALTQAGTKINFKKANPRRPGTKAFDNYEKYKVAKTVAKARELGATTRDLQYDFERGNVDIMKKATVVIAPKPGVKRNPDGLILSDINRAMKKGEFKVSKTGGKPTVRAKLKKEGDKPPMAGGKSKRQLLKEGKSI
jgi:hypothetical protein